MGRVVEALGPLKPEFRQRARIQMDEEEKNQQKTGSSGSGFRSAGSSNQQKRKFPHEEEDPFRLSKYSENQVPLPQLVKRTELAVQDLKVLIEVSSLSEGSRIMLVERLDRYHKQAKAVGRQISALQAIAEASLDRLAIGNTYLMKELEQIRQQQESVGEVNLFNSMMSLVPGGGPYVRKLEASQKKLAKIYKASMDGSQERIRRVILLTKEVLDGLNTLSESLGTINKIAKIEGRIQSQQLSELWTFLGRNRVQRENFEDNIELLSSMDVNRLAAQGQVQSALMSLQRFEDDLGNLKEDISKAAWAPELDDESDIPLVDKVNAPREGEDSRRGYRGFESSTLMKQIDMIAAQTHKLKRRSLMVDDTLNARADKMSGHFNSDDL